MPDLAILGPIPPPHGGVAVHVERLLPHLDRRGIRWKVYNTAGLTEEPERIQSVWRGRARWFARFLLAGREPVVFLHGTTWTVWAAIPWLVHARRKRVVLTVHIALERVLRGSALRKAWVRRGLRSATRIIAVSQAIAEELVVCGVDRERISVIPAFIAPEWGAPGEGLSAEVMAFCESHSPLLLATGGAVWMDGGDVYGLDLSLDLVERLSARHPDIGLLWFLLQPLHRSPEHESRMCARAAEAPLASHVLLVPASGPMHNAYALADVVLRPTATDGDPLTVREAHAAGVPTLVSDACPRPAQCKVFSPRNVEAMEASLEPMLENLQAARARVAGTPAPLGPEAILEVLAKLLPR